MNLYLQFSKYKSFFATVFVFIFLFLPFIGQATSTAGLVPCDGGAGDKCDLNDVGNLINGIINWILSIAGIIFTISVVWSGFLYMTSGTNPGNKTKAKDMMLSTLYGFLLILLSWLIVYTIVKTAASGNGNKSDSILKYFKTT